MLQSTSSRSPSPSSSPSKHQADEFCGRKTVLLILTIITFILCGVCLIANIWTLHESENQDTLRRDVLGIGFSSPLPSPHTKTPRSIEALSTYCHRDGHHIRPCDHFCAKIAGKGALCRGRFICIINTKLPSSSRRHIQYM